MLLHILPDAAVYQGQGDKGEVLPRHRYKETRILVINTETFYVENELKYVETVFMFIFSSDLFTSIWIMNLYFYYVLI